MPARVPEIRVHVTDVAIFVAMRRIDRELGRGHIDPRHLSWIVREEHRDDVRRARCCLEASLYEDFAVSGWMKLHESKFQPSLGDLPLNPVNIHTQS